jgi:TonB dependent receptor-like, beta-barrel/Carboxypeptidase regulatory-like domain
MNLRNAGLRRSRRRDSPLDHSNLGPNGLRGLGVPLLLIGLVLHSATPARAAQNRQADVPQKNDPELVGSIEGAVVDRETGRPVSGVIVVVEGTSLSAAVGNDGRFRIERVPAVVHIVRAEAPGYVPLSSPELKVSANRSVAVILELTRSLSIREEVFVTIGTGSRPPNVTTSSFEMGREEVRRSAGSMGDVNRLVQALPGLAVLGDLRNDLVARGGSPSENLTLVDGIEVPTVNHFPTTGTTGGVVAMLNNELIDDASFLAGGFPAEHGNRLSSVLDIHLREGDRSRSVFEADVNFAGAALIAEGPLGPRGSWLATGRRSFLDMFSRAAGGDVEDALPRMSDYTFKMNYDVGPRDHVWVVAFGGSDTIRLVGDADNVEEPDFLTIDNAGWRTVTGVAWRHLFGATAFGLFTASDALTHYDVEVRNGALGDAQEFVNQSVEGETTLKYDLSWQLSNRLTLRGGGSWKRFRRSVVIAQPLGIDTPFSVQPREDVPGVDLDLDATAQIRAGHVQLAARLVPRVTLTVGARIDHFQALDSTKIGPRVGVETSMTPRLTVSVSAGRYYQQPELTSIVARPENARLTPMEADHVVVGTAYQPRADVRITVEAYRKWYRGYPVSLDFPELTLANHGIDFDMSDILLPLASRGRGRSSGVEVFVKKRLSGASMDNWHTPCPVQSRWRSTASSAAEPSIRRIF